MTETPDQMLRRVLSELYPRPNPYRGFTEAAQRFADASSLFGAFVSRLSAALRLAPTEPCCLCGGWGGHEDGCALGERA